MASAAWGPEYSGWPEAVIIDTAGNMLDHQPMLENDYLASTGLTIDNKYLFYTQDIDENEEFDAYLFKLNQNLESDTVYTQQFTYDSLCPYDIVSDTIALDDCGIIVGDAEIYRQTEKNRLVIYPNPAGDKFTVQSGMFETGDCRLVIVDLFGRKAEEIYVSKGEAEMEVSTRGWKKGMYVVRVTGQNGATVSMKVIVK